MIGERDPDSAPSISPLSSPEYQFLVQSRENTLRKLLNPLEAVIMRIQSVLVWERPGVSVTMLLFVNFMFWLATTSNLRFYYLAAMTVLLIVFVETWKNRIWPEIRVPTPEDEDSEGWTPVHPRLLSVPELAHCLAEYWTTLTYYSNEFWNLRRNRPARFCLYVGSSCLLLAIAGTYITGIMISYIIVMSLLLWPCMYYHNFLKKFYMKFEPLLMQLHYSMKIKRKRAHHKKPTSPEDEDKDRVETESDSELESFVPPADPEVQAALARAITDSEDEGTPSPSPSPSPMKRSMERELPMDLEEENQDLSDIDDFAAGLHNLPSFTDTRLEETEADLMDFGGLSHPGDRVGDASIDPPMDDDSDPAQTPSVEENSMKFVSSHFKDSDSSENGDDTIGEGTLGEGLDFHDVDMATDSTESESKDTLSTAVVAAVASQMVSQTLSNVVSGTLSSISRLTETVRVPTGTPAISEIVDTPLEGTARLRRSPSNSDPDLGDFEFLDKNELESMSDEKK